MRKIWGGLAKVWTSPQRRPSVAVAVQETALIDRDLSFPRCTDAFNLLAHPYYYFYFEP